MDGVKGRSDETTDNWMRIDRHAVVQIVDVTDCQMIRQC